MVVYSRTGMFLCLFMVGFLYSQEVKEINIATDSWPAVTEKDGTGLLFELIRLVYKSGGVTMNYEIVPYARAVAKVLSNSADAWISSGLNEEPGALYPKYYHNAIRNVIIYKKDRIKAWNGPDDLAGKKVCWVRGYNLNLSWGIDTAKFTLVEVTTPVQGLKMLEAGRVDFFVDVDKQIENDLKETKMDTQQFVIKPAYEQKLYLAFANNSRGKILRNIWDRQMEKIRFSDEIKKIFEKYDMYYSY